MGSLDGICLKVGTVLNDTYKIKRVITIGEGAIIYLGLHIYMGEMVAIKEFFPRKLVLRDLDNITVVNRLPSMKDTCESLRTDFINEAIILQQIHHEQIVKYLDHFEGNGTIYIVTKYYEGVTLNDYLKNIPLKERKKLYKNIFFPVINALQYLHRKGIIHRDIKPSNIIITPEKGVHLLDFGAAAFYKNQAEFRIYTTSGFSPLEQYSKQSVQGIRTDIYSFAATLYYSLTDVLLEDISQRLMKRKIKSVRLYTNEISFLLASIINWGLAVNPKKRCFSLDFFKLAFFIDKWIR